MRKRINYKKRGEIAKIKIGSVVQVSPDKQKDGFFPGCFMLVTEVNSWGVQGFVAIPEKRGVMPNEAFFRAKFDEVELIGDAVFVPESLLEEIQKDIAGK